MAVNTYRFQFRGPTSTDVSRALGTNATATRQTPPLLSATVYEDYTIDETKLSDLIAHLENPGPGLYGSWEYVGLV